MSVHDHVPLDRPIPGAHADQRFTGYQCNVMLVLEASFLAGRHRPTSAARPKSAFIAANPNGLSLNREDGSCGGAMDLNFV